MVSGFHRITQNSHGRSPYFQFINSIEEPNLSPCSFYVCFSRLLLRIFVILECSYSLPTKVFVALKPLVLPWVLFHWIDRLIVGHVCKWIYSDI